MGRASKGVRAMKLREDDHICSVCPIKPKYSMVIVSDGGYAKTFLATLITPQKRAGVGMSIFKFNKNGSNGKKIVSAYATRDIEKEIMIIQEDSSHRYIPIGEISELPLASAGKPLFEWQEGVSGCVVMSEFATRAKQ